MLTMLLTIDAEKPERYTEYFVAGLRQWNRSALDQVQLLAITQKPRDAHTPRALARLPMPVTIVAAEHETAAGYPLWSVMESVRRAWGLVRGEYVTFSHTEFLHGPERLKQTLEHLQRHRPILALGNLRRPGPSIATGEAYDRHRECELALSERITSPLSKGDACKAAMEYFEMPTTHWVAWESAPREGVCRFAEDIFFARRDWLDTIEFFDHADRLYFQDVYDLLGEAIMTLAGEGLAPACYRLSLDTHQAIHLWHERSFACWQPAVRDWFLSQPERFMDTVFIDGRVWDALIPTCPGADEPRDVDGTALGELRSGYGGTVFRYGGAFRQWLAEEGNRERLRAYYDRGDCISSWRSAYAGIYSAPSEEDIELGTAVPA